MRIQFKMISLFVLLFSFSVQAVVQARSDQEQFSIALEGHEVKIKIPEQAWQNLNKWNKNFKVYELSDYSPSVMGVFDDASKVPMAYMADVDGDQTQDIILLGEDKSQQKVVAILNKNKKFEVIEVKSWGDGTVKKTKIPLLNSTSKSKKVERGVPVYIAEPQGEVVEKIKNKKGIQIETYLGSTEVYVIENNKSELIAK